MDISSLAFKYPHQNRVDLSFYCSLVVVPQLSRLLSFRLNEQNECNISSRRVIQAVI